MVLSIAYWIYDVKKKAKSYAAWAKDEDRAINAATVQLDYGTAN
jgi:hypothetical protein